VGRDDDDDDDDDGDGDDDDDDDDDDGGCSILSSLSSHPAQKHTRGPSAPTCAKDYLTFGFSTTTTTSFGSHFVALMIMLFGCTSDQENVREKTRHDASSGVDDDHEKKAYSFFRERG